MMKNTIPDFFTRLKQIIPPEHYEAVCASFKTSDDIVVRINTLKMSPQEILPLLSDVKHVFIQGIDYAFRMSRADKERLQYLFDDGILYAQSLSSLLPVLVLDPKPGEKVLDMCAAPGSKTSQITMHQNLEGELIAVEAIKNRFFKLKAVLKILGMNEYVDCKILDARRYRSDELFDKILVDAPCSSSGRFKEGDPKTYRYWSVRKIKDMQRKQKGILMNASRLLKPGGVLVYSTCTFAPEENEGVVQWLLRKTEGLLKLDEIGLPKGIETYPSQNMPLTKRILPNQNHEGFFIAKFIKS